MTSQASGAVLLALFLGVSTMPAHAGVYKWVDENGSVHYSEHPPEKGSHSQLHIPAAPSKPQPSSKDQSVWQQRQMESDQREKERWAAEKKRQVEEEKGIRESMAAQEERWKQEEQRRADEKKARDNGLVAECNRNREIYCDQGVERIKREEELRRADDDLERRRARLPIINN